jgi:hypothetical protein
MPAIRSLSLSLLLAATLWPADAQATRTYPHNVTNLVASPRVCTGRALYEYSATWSPATWNGQIVQRYKVNAHNCVTGAVACTPLRCSVKASQCRTGAPGPWIAVQADVGAAISGVRAKAAPPSRCL